MVRKSASNRFRANTRNRLCIGRIRKWQAGEVPAFARFPGPVAPTPPGKGPMCLCSKTRWWRPQRRRNLPQVAYAPGLRMLQSAQLAMQVAGKAAFFSCLSKSPGNRK